MIQGNVYENKLADLIVLDFKNFGLIERAEFGTYKIKAYIKPINPDPVDSLEDTSNSIEINIVP